MLLFIYTFFFFLLVLHVPLYYIFVDANRADKIASSPEMISPVWLFFHLWVAFEQLYGQFTFQYPHHLRNRHLRRNRHDNMNVINLDTHFLNLTFFPFTQQPYILFYQLLDFSCQDSKPVFGYPNNMILTLVNNMRQFFVLTHAANIGIADRTLPPPKEVGF
jgi:hypothetical protein